MAPLKLRNKKGRKKPLSLRSRSRNCVNARKFKLMVRGGCFNYITNIICADSSSVLNYHYFVMKFLDIHIIQCVPFSSEYNNRYCNHILVSSALMYELWTNTLNDVRMHEFFFTVKNRYIGKIAEDLIRKQNPDIIDRKVIRCKSLPFIIASSDGFLRKVNRRWR